MGVLRARVEQDAGENPGIVGIAATEGGSWCCQEASLPNEWGQLNLKKAEDREKAGVQTGASALSEHWQQKAFTLEP